MALSPGVARQHIQLWTERLRRSPRSANWPAHLFHATDLKNALPILANGVLSCRSRLVEIPCDAANQEALWNNPEAHEYVRLYFRPRTSFHLSTEGIKCIGDPYRREPHMSIPVMLAFDAESLLAREGAGFSRGMLSRKRPIGFDEDFFRSIDFDKVYHDGPLSKENDAEVQDKRMAEVVVPAELPLLPSLRKVICRTPLELKTLRYQLGEHAWQYFSQIVVEQIQQSTFLHRALYLTEVGFRSGVLSLGFHAPMKPPSSGRYRIEVEQRVGGQIVQSWRGETDASQAGARIPGFRDIAEGVWKIELEGCLAYEAPIPSQISVIR